MGMPTRKGSFQNFLVILMEQIDINFYDQSNLQPGHLMENGGTGIVSWKQFK